MELPAFQLSMNVFFRFHRNAPGSLELVWRDLADRLSDLCLPARSLDCFYFKPQARKPIFTLKNGAKNKKPGVERRAQPPVISVAPREAQQILASARKVPHSRIWLLPYRPDRESPDQPGGFGNPPNHV